MRCEEACFWYDRQAVKWIEALPLGNGRMGAMVYGGTNEFKVQLDESTFWSGEPSDENDRPGMPNVFRRFVQRFYKRIMVGRIVWGRNL